MTSAHTWRRPLGGALRAARRHRTLTVFLVLGLLLRLAATLAYSPALLYIDSFGYLNRAYVFDAGSGEPLGYSWFLRAVLSVGDLTTVAVLQHLMGLAMAVAIYALLRRYGVRGPLAACAVAPLLLDAYQVQLEENVLSDTLFEALLVAAVTVMAWRRRPRLGRLGAGALLLGCAAEVRNVGDVLILIALAFPLLPVRGQRRVAGAAVALLAFLLPVAASVGVSYAETGSLFNSSQGSYALYGRAATVADCARLPLTADERLLCPTQPLGHRYDVDYYVSNPDAPLQKQTALVSQGRSDLNVARAETDFARVVILHQPWDFTKAVLADVLHGFGVNSHVSALDIPASRWQFQTTYPAWGPAYPASVEAQTAARFGQGAPRVDTVLATALRDYQLHGGATPGPLLGAAALLALAGGLPLPRLSRRVRDSGLRPVCLLVTAAGLGALLAADVFEYSLRYQIPGVALLPAAGALGFTALTWRRAPAPALPAAAEPVTAARLASWAGR